MPAKSKSQQKLFGMALAYKKGKDGFASKKVKEIAKKMSKKEIEKFAKTKHKGLKEHRAFSFNEFLNEAYVDQEGQLKDFSTDDSELLDLHVEDQEKTFIKNTKTFFEEHEAKDVYVRIKGPLAHIAFEFYGKEYGIVVDIIRGYCELAELDQNRPMGAHVLGQFSDFGILVDLIREHGLYFLHNIKENE